MEKSDNRQENDITNESYKGASPAIQGFGEAFWSHWIWAGLGLGVGAGLSYIVPGWSKKALNAIREVSRSGANSKPLSISKLDIFWSNSKETAGKFGLWVFGHGDDAKLRAEKELVVGAADGLGLTRENIGRSFENRKHGFGYALVNHTFGELPYFRKPIRKWLRLIDENSAYEHHTTALSNGGFLGAFGFFIMPFFFGIVGARNAHKGKDQFERAKDEISELREDYSRLRDKYVKVKTQLQDCDTEKAAENGKLTVAEDNPPKMRETTPATSIDTATIAREGIKPAAEVTRA
jgi:hypothetical protein